MKYQLFFILILCVTYRSVAQSDQDTFESVLHKFTEYQQHHTVEKVFLHLDKTIYGSGEDIWFKAYLVDGAFHNPAKLSTLLYVELINYKNKIIASRNIKIENGVGIGDFLLDDSLESGNYTIRAYSEYMKNFDNIFRQKIKVINSSTSLQADFPTLIEDISLVSSKKNIDLIPKSPEIDVQFFPEGGHMIDGLVNYVAFKAVNNNGQSINLSGYVLNSKGETITDIKTSKFGMGKFVIVPKINETYTALVNYKGSKYTFELPLCKPKGYLMTLRRGSEKISLTVSNNMGISMKNTFLIGHVRGVVFKYLRVVDEKDYFHITIPMDSIPSGIAQFTFFDQNGLPRTERIVYVSSKLDSVSLQIKLGNNDFGIRKKVEVSLSASDFKNSKLNGNVSVSIVNAETLTPEQDVANIESYLLLSSEIKGHIENPNYYFNIKNEDRNEILDLLMLTQGWRKFTWNEILKDTSATLIHYPENGFSISGQLFDYYNRKKTVVGNVTLNSMNSLLIDETLTTSENGRFSFEGLDINDSISLIIQATKIPKSKKNKGSKTKKTNDPIFISIDTHHSPEITSSLINNEDGFINPDVLAYSKQNYKIKQIEDAFFINNGAIVLEEVTIKRSMNKIDDPYYRSNQIYTTPNQRLILDSIPSTKTVFNFLDVLRANVPGLSIIGTMINQKIVIRGFNSIQGNNTALITLDGMPIDFEGASMISPQIISHIDILKGPNAVVYGIRGASGVVAIYTKRHVDIEAPEWKSWGIIDINHPGYYKSRDFYTPKYDEVNITDKNNPDFRNTLYWNPEVYIGEEEKSKFEFYTSDEITTYLIQVQGMSETDKPIVGESFFSVK